MPIFPCQRFISGGKATKPKMKPGMETVIYQQSVNPKVIITTKALHQPGVSQDYLK